MQNFKDYLISNGFNKQQINDLLLSIYNDDDETHTRFSVNLETKNIVEGEEWRRMVNHPINALVIKSNSSKINNEILYQINGVEIKEITAEYFVDIKQEYLRSIEWIDRCIPTYSFNFEKRKNELIKFLNDGAKGENNDTAPHEYRWDPIPVWSLRNDDEDQTYSELSIIKELLKEIDDNIVEWSSELHERDSYEYDGYFKWSVGNKLVDYWVYVDEGNTEFSWSCFVREGIIDEDDDDKDSYDDDTEDDDDSYDDDDTEDDDDSYDDDD